MLKAVLKLFDGIITLPPDTKRKGDPFTWERQSCADVALALATMFWKIIFATVTNLQELTIV